MLRIAFLWFGNKAASNQLYVQALECSNSRKFLKTYSKKDARSNSPTGKKIDEKAPSSNWFSFIIFTQILFFSVFFVFASSSPSQDNKDDWKKVMLVNWRYFENNDFVSWSCFYLESQFHISDANVSKTSRKVQFVRKHNLTQGFT